MRKVLYSPHMAYGVFDIVRDCSPCAENSTLGKRQRQLQLFFSKAQLEYNGMYILKPLARTKQCNKFVVAMMVRHMKLTKVLSTTNNIASLVTLRLLEH